MSRVVGVGSLLLFCFYLFIFAGNDGDRKAAEKLGGGGGTTKPIFS